MMRFDATLFILLALALFVTPRPADDAPPRRLDFAGFSVELPEGWEGPVEADTAHLPTAATYRIRNAADGPLAGASLTVHVRTNLNPLQRQNWMRGRAPVDLGTLRPVEPLSGEALPFTGAGFRAESRGSASGRQAGGRAALVYFTAHGPVYYALVAEAPARGFAEMQPALLGVVRSVQFSAAASAATATAAAD
jgi:hypothetical protein